MANRDREQQSARDTHFAGFAEAAVRKMGSEHWFDSYYPDDWNSLEFPEDPSHPDDIYEEAMVFIARLAYDLVFHTIENTSCHDLDVLNTEEHVLRIPDMTELPEVP